tara:strand:+ start:95442 stop:95828 length:387 start_codon:yes stop_codon:yes gene_type:complete
MSSSSLIKQFLLALSAVCIVSTLTACGGSSSNVSPGTIVVPPDDPNGPDVPVDPNEPPPPSGDTVLSVIPSSLGSAIYDSGETAPDGKPIYIIDVAALPGGALNPAGLLLGNDFIYRIEGGALRITQN